MYSQTPCMNLKRKLWRQLQHAKNLADFFFTNKTVNKWTQVYSYERSMIRDKRSDIYILMYYCNLCWRFWNGPPENRLAYMPGSSPHGKFWWYISLKKQKQQQVNYFHCSTLYPGICKQTTGGKFWIHVNLASIITFRCCRVVTSVSGNHGGSAMMEANFNCNVILSGRELHPSPIFRLL